MAEPMVQVGCNSVHVNSQVADLNEVATSPAASESPPGHVLDATLSVAVPQVRTIFC